MQLGNFISLTVVTAILFSCGSSERTITEGEGPELKIDLRAESLQGIWEAKLQEGKERHFFRPDGSMVYQRHAASVESAQHLIPVSIEDEFVAKVETGFAELDEKAIPILTLVLTHITAMGQTSTAKVGDRRVCAIVGKSEESISLRCSPWKPAVGNAIASRDLQDVTIQKLAQAEGPDCTMGSQAKLCALPVIPSETCDRHWLEFSCRDLDTQGCENVEGGCKGFLPGGYWTYTGASGSPQRCLCPHRGFRSTP